MGKAEVRKKLWSKTNKYDREKPSKFEMMLLETLSEKENSPPRDPAQNIFRNCGGKIEEAQ